MFEYKYTQPLTERLTLSGDLDKLREAVERGEKINNGCFTLAARRGHVHIMDYLLELGLEPHADTQDSASFWGHLNVLEWLNDKGFLRKKNSPFNGCNSAARRGNLDCLKFLHENGVKWDYSTYFSAKHNDCMEIIQYLEENGCPQEEPQRHTSDEEKEWARTIALNAIIVRRSRTTPTFFLAERFRKLIKSSNIKWIYQLN